MIIDPEDFSYEDSSHEYRNASGLVCPSVTQALKAAGIFDYSGVKPEVLENARRRGTNVHNYTAEFDRHGEIDETWLLEDEAPRYQAWLKFRKESGLIIREIEQPMLRSIAGVQIGGTPDRVGFIGSTKFVIDIKNCAQKHPGWALQTAMYEQMLTGSARVGHMGRMVVMLKPNGTYKTVIYEDNSDGDAVLALVQKIAAEEAINNWKRNAGLLKAA